MSDYDDIEDEQDENLPEEELDEQELDARSDLMDFFADNKEAVFFQGNWRLGSRINIFIGLQTGRSGA